MSEVTEAMEQIQVALDEAVRQATRLGRMLLFNIDDNGRPAIFAIPEARSLLAQAMRDASAGCEWIGVQHDDTRWCAPVALISHAGQCVYALNETNTCLKVAELMVRLRTQVGVLRDRARAAPVRVWLQ